MVVLVLEWFVIGVIFRYFLRNDYVGIVQKGIGGNFVPITRNVYKSNLYLLATYLSALILGIPVLNNLHVSVDGG